MEKRLRTRIQHKAGTENDWKSAEGKFKPLKGEFIVYLPDDNYDYSRLKIGTGEDDIKDLPFLTYSAYDIAVASGYDGTEQEWLDSLIGRGVSGVSADRVSSGSNGEMKVTVNYTDGTSEKPFSIYNGEKGEQGDKGDTGVGIASIQTTPTTEAGAANKVKITLTDPNANPVELNVYNGKNGTVTPEELSELKQELVGEIQEKCHTEIFDTYEDLYKTLTGITIQWSEENNEWEEIEEEETEEALIEREALLTSFQSGDVFLIKDLNVPDYWWESFGDATSFTIPRPNYPTEIIVPGFGAARVLETQKTDLTHHLELDNGNQGTIDLTNFKLRVAADGDQGLDGYITFII